MIPNGLRGKTRLAKACLASQLSAQDVQLQDRCGNFFSIPSLREPIGFHLRVDGVYEEKALEFILNNIDPGSVFLDVGANIGAFSVPAARKVGAAGKVLAIEASPKIFPYLTRNVELNKLSNVRCFNVAASNEEGQLPFYEAPLDHFGMGSMGAQFHAQPVTIRARTLDQILKEEKIEHVALIKIDVEGFEAKVLQGSRALLKCSRPPIIVFEFIDWAEARVTGSEWEMLNVFFWNWASQFGALTISAKDYHHLGP
jgi:FkbM family methyltransferase